MHVMPSGARCWHHIFSARANCRPERESTLVGNQLKVVREDTVLIVKRVGAP